MSEDIPHSVRERVEGFRRAVEVIDGESERVEGVQRAAAPSENAS